MTPRAACNYRLGALLGVTTALLYSLQEPLTYLAARQLDADQFILVTQVSLLVSVPLLIARRRSRRDFAAIVATPRLYPKLAAILAMGLTGLWLYKRGLAGEHPVIIAAIFNLSPFWAAMVARLVSGVGIPVRAPVFFGCLAAAFAGAMTVAWSQAPQAPAGGDLIAGLLAGSWIFAVPIPILSALNGTLIGEWFGDYDESAAIAVNFVAPAAVLIPYTALTLAERGGLTMVDGKAIGLMMAGSILSGAVGRVAYQIALSETRNDNGFVTMFFLLVPALTGLVSAPLALIVPSLRFAMNPAYFVGLALIAAALALFSWRTWRGERGPRRL